MSVFDLQQDHADQTTQTVPAEVSAGTVARLPTATEIQVRLVEEVARLLEVEPQVIDVVQPFDRYGLDSMAAVNLTAVLEKRLPEQQKGLAGPLAAGVASAAATPLDTWQNWATNVRGSPVDSGHFLTEENPEVTGRMLREFFLGA